MGISLLTHLPKFSFQYNEDPQFYSFPQLDQNVISLFYQQTMR